jgi:hypothetical protein
MPSQKQLVWRPKRKITYVWVSKGKANVDFDCNDDELSSVSSKLDDIWIVNRNTTLLYHLSDDELLEMSNEELLNFHDPYYCDPFYFGKDDLIPNQNGEDDDDDDDDY